MAQSLLALKTRGTGFPQAFRVIAATPYALGATFLTQLIGAVTLGSFAPGDTVTYDGGTHNAKVTQVFSGRLVLNTIDAGWAPASGTITNGTAIATAAGVEGLENAGTAPFNRACARVIQFHNEIYLYHYNTIYKLNQASGFFEESYRVANPAAPDGNADSLRHLGLYIINFNDVPNLMTLYSDGSTNTYRIRSADGAAWSEAIISTGTPPRLNNEGGSVGTPWRNVLYVYNHDIALGVTASFAYDPSTDGYSSSNARNFPGRPFIWNNRFFYISFSGYGGLSELVGGVWVDGATVPGIAPNYSYFGFVSPSSGALIVICHDNGGVVHAMKYTMIAGVVQPGVDISGAILPSSVTGTASIWVIDGYVDQEMNALAGGPAKVFLWFALTEAVGTPRAYYEFVDDSTPMQAVGAGCPVEIALPHTADGGGERSFFPGELHPDIVAAMLPVTGGERISFKLYQRPGDAPVTGVKLKIAYGDQGSYPMLAFATLSNPSAGSLVNPHEVDGLVADGTTLYQVTWLAVSSDGEPNYANLQRALLVYT